MSIPNLNDKPNFGDNQGVWEYRTHDNQLLGYSVRKQKGDGKRFVPWSFQNNEWVMKWYESETKPIYNCQEIPKNPQKPILIVEGEKTADAAQKLLPDWVCVTWMGGSSSASKIDTAPFKDKKVCIWPDNDEPGHKAADKIKKALKDIASHVGVVNPTILGVATKWDLADFNEENSEIDFDSIMMAIDDAGKQFEQFDISTYPELTGSDKNPRPLDTTRNLKHLLDYFSITVRWNMMKRIREVNIPGVKLYQEEAENQSLTYITNLAVVNEFSVRRIDKHLDQLAWDNIYHPVRDWILSEPLVDYSQFDQFIKILKTTDDDLSQLLLKRWLISAIGVLFNEGNFIAQGVLVLHGTGGWRKSTFIAMLAPQELNAIKKGAELDTSSKDNLIRLAGYWIAELGELGGTINKSDANKLKSHITNDLDEARRPFAAKDSKMVRRTIYAGTVNEENFLVDETGNRRWWAISLTESIDTDAIEKLNMQQIWRAAYELYVTGERAYLNDEEISQLNKSNEKHEYLSPFDEKLDAYFNWDNLPYRWMNATQILEAIGYGKPSKAESTRMGCILTKRGVTKGTGSKIMQRCYLMPNYKNDTEKM